MGDFLGFFGWIFGLGGLLFAWGVYRRIVEGDAGTPEMRSLARKIENGAFSKYPSSSCQRGLVRGLRGR